MPITSYIYHFFVMRTFEISLALLRNEKGTGKRGEREKRE
jgi:hypothetical protein